MDVFSTLLTDFPGLKVIVDAAPLFADAALGTVQYSAIALLLGFPLGVVISAASFSNILVVRSSARLFVSFFRSVPLLVLLLIAFYGLPSMGLNTTAPQAAIMALVVVEAAYLSECVRGGFLAMPKGQVEAAGISGFSRWQTMRFVTLPTVFRLTLPSIVNEATMAVKASSLISVVGILELTRMSQNLASSTFRPLEIYLTAGVVYLLINLVVIWAGRHFEAQLNKGFR